MLGWWTGADEDQAVVPGRKTGWGTFGGHFSVRTARQGDLGILRLKCGMCGPAPAVPQAKIRIKSSSSPCPGQSQRGSTRRSGGEAHFPAQQRRIWEFNLARPEGGEGGLYK